MKKKRKSFYDLYTVNITMYSNPAIFADRWGKQYSLFLFFFFKLVLLKMINWTDNNYRKRQ